MPQGWRTAPRPTGELLLAGAGGEITVWPATPRERERVGTFLWRQLAGDPFAILRSGAARTRVEIGTSTGLEGFHVAGDAADLVVLEDETWRYVVSAKGDPAAVRPTLAALVDGVVPIPSPVAQTAGAVAADHWI